MENVEYLEDKQFTLDDGNNEHYIIKTYLIVMP